MQIDPKDPTPIYRQIVAEIQSAIAAGVYRPGECLPSLRVLAVKIGVNPNTVQRAYDELEREGTLESRRGVGVFVTDRRTSAARDSGERKFVRSVKSAIKTALKEDIPIDRLRSLFDQALGESRRQQRRVRS